MAEDLKGSELYCLLRKIKSLFHGGKRTLKIIVVSRRYPQCLENTLSSFTHISLDSEHENNVRSDIDSYITTRLEALTQERRISQSLAEHIEETFHEKSQGTFLWVSFMLEDFQNKSVASIEKALDSLPCGLDEVYERILLQIRPENTTIIAEILIWVALSFEPLNVIQLAEAVGIQASEHLSRNEICLSHIESCGHLLQIHYQDDCVLPRNEKEEENSSSNSTEKYGSDITLVHQSVKDFLTQQNLSPKLKSFQVHEARGYLLIMERFLCLIQGDWQGSPEPKFERSRWCTLYYHVREYWTDYLRRLENRDLLHLVENNKLFFADHSDIRYLWGYYPRYSGKSILQFACEEGLVPLVEEILEQRRRNPIRNLLSFQKSVNKPQPNTPLALAVVHKHTTLVEVLLKFGATVGVVSSRHGAEHVMQLATRADLFNIFELLSETKGGKRYIKRDLASRAGRDSLLHCSVKNGNNKLCRILLEKYRYEVDAPGEYSPLHLAIKSRLLDTARMLAVDYGASTKDHDAIISALIEGSAYSGDAVSEELMQLIFFELGVDINHQDGSGRTIPHLLLEDNDPDRERGYFKLLKQCLAHGCDPTLRNMENNPPFHMAKWFSTLGNESYGPMHIFSMQNIILLVCVGGLDINTPGNGGILLLHRFIQDAFDPKTSGHKLRSYNKIKGMRMLLDLGADRNIKTSRGLTAVQVAKQCYDTTKDKKSFEGYCAETLADFTDILENYATVTNSVQNLAYAGFEMEERRPWLRRSNAW
ncbi:unnamed protein product [Clonostachys rosea]|uniref:NACHT domain-containing protein n=1 Tax=Bionectria ochroleuca TaxID=29856 RepID=A0ABY6TRN2_BIOOC|nr:unnamed protein product [Clonostachys rosea]